MERLTHSDLVKKIESLRGDVRDLMFRVQLISVDVESTRRHQAMSKQQCIQILKDLETVTDNYNNFLTDVRSKAYGNE